jgi:hypothetical protein
MPIIDRRTITPKAPFVELRTQVLSKLSTLARLALELQLIAWRKSRRSASECNQEKFEMILASQLK